MLTIDDIEKAKTDERWLGYGYLGERDLALDAVRSGEWPAESGEHIAASDRFVVEYANQHGWTYDRLVEWLNSRNARHFADQAFSGLIERAVSWKLI